MEQNNLNLEQIRGLLATLKSKIAIIREKYEKNRSMHGEDHPLTLAARKDLDDLLLELKNLIYWLNTL